MLPNILTHPWAEPKPLRERPSPELLSLSEHSQKNWFETWADVIHYGMSIVTFCSKAQWADHALKRAELERKLKNWNRWLSLIMDAMHRAQLSDRVGYQPFQ